MASSRRLCPYSCDQEAVDIASTVLQELGLSGLHPIPSYTTPWDATQGASGTSLGHVRSPVVWMLFSQDPPARPDARVTRSRLPSSRRECPIRAKYRGSKAARLAPRIVEITTCDVFSGRFAFPIAREG